jgi:hypothetical protein
MNDTLSQLRSAFMDKRYEQVTSLYQQYNQYLTERSNAIKDMRDYNDKKASEIEKKNQEVQAQRDEIAMNAAKGGLTDPKLLDAISNATTVSEAISLAGEYLQTATGDMAEYLFYKRQAQQSGQPIATYGEWQAEKDKKALEAKYSESYASAKGAAAGRAAIEGLPSTSTGGDAYFPQELPADPNSGSILSQTGLSIGAFNYITQGTSTMSRMNQAMRVQIMTEAQNWLNSKGIDLSTFQASYKAYNDVVAKNIQRYNNSVIMEGEILGTLDNLSAAADAADFGKMKVTNLAKYFAGEQVNDPAIMKYGVHFNQLVTEMAGYNAAVQGKSAPDIAEMEEAKRVIQNGVSSKSLAGFTDAIKASTEKMGIVLKGSVDRANKQVWDLFGVGDKYGGSASAGDSLMQDTDNVAGKIADFATSSPQNQSLYDKARTMFPDATPQELANELGISL